MAYFVRKAVLRVYLTSCTALLRCSLFITNSTHVRIIPCPRVSVSGRFGSGSILVGAFHQISVIRIHRTSVYGSFAVLALWRNSPHDKSFLVINVHKFFERLLKSLALETNCTQNSTTFNSGSIVNLAVGRVSYV